MKAKTNFEKKLKDTLSSVARSVSSLFTKNHMVKIKYIAIGSKGTAGVLGDIPAGLTLGKAFSTQWVNCKDYGVSAKSVCISHGNGKASGFTCYDIGCFVSERGSAFKVYALTDALKQGVIKAHSVKVQRDGKVTAVTVYAPAKWTPAVKQLRTMAVDGIPALRIENSKVSSDGRNIGLIAYIVADKVKAAKAPAKPKAKSKAKSKAKPTTKAPVIAPVETAVETPAL